ncbi:MAG: hypothetical protein ACJ75J_09110 [Cytophagaceae bacterium]
MFRSVLFIVALFCSSCSFHHYQLNEYEKDSQKGYHRVQADQIIDKNKKTKKQNVKASEKNKKDQQEDLNKLNSEATNKVMKKTRKHHGTFKYYWH